MSKPFDSEVGWIEPCLVEIPFVLNWLLQVSGKQEPLDLLIC